MAIRNIREEKTTSSSGIKKVEGFVQTQTSPQGVKVVQPKVSTGSTVSSAPKTEVKSVQPTIQTVGFSSVRKSPATKVSDTITNVRPITSPVTTPAAPTVNANASKRTVPGQNINNVNKGVANARQRQSAIVNPVTNPGAPLQKAQVSNVQKNDAGSKGKLDSFIDATGASIASNYARNIANLADMAARADKGRAISDSIKTNPDNFNASLGLMQSMPSREELAQTGMTDEQIDKALNSLNGTRASDTADMVSEGMGRVADQKAVEAERNSRNLNRLENFASRSISGAINQAPQMILNMAAPGSGDLWIAATSYADAYNDAESRGIDSATAAGYGALVAGIEVASNYISSANKFDPKGILDDWQDALVANSGAKGGKALLMHYALNVLGEQIEEEAATIPEFLVDYFMLKGNRTEDGKFDWKKFWKEIGQTFIDTLGSTVVLNGLTGEYSRASANDFLQSIEDYRNADPYQNSLELVREAVKSWDRVSQEDKNLTLRAVAEMNGEDPAALSDRIEEAVENAKANGILETESEAEVSSEAVPENTAQENPAQNEQDDLTSSYISSDVSGKTAEEAQKVHDYLNSTDKKVKDFVSDVLNRASNKFRWIKFSQVNNKQIADVKRLLGVDITGFKNGLSESGVQHIVNRHGINGDADPTMADVNDIARIPFVLDNYDTARILVDENGKQVFSTGLQTKGNPSSPAPLVEFIKQIDGSMYVTMAIVDSNRKTIWVETAFINKNASPIGTTVEPSGSTSSTSKTSPMATSVSDNTIPSVNQEVNPGDPIADALLAQQAAENAAQDQDALTQALLDQLTPEQERTPISEYEGEQIFRSALDESEIAMPVKAFGKRLGRDIVVVEDLPLHANGVWMDGKIYIPESVIRSGKETWMVVRHELTHSLRGAKVFDKYINYAVDQMRTQMGENWENYYNQKVQDYSRAYAGAENFDSLINEEIAAEYTQEYLFNNQEAVNQLVRSSRSTAQRIWQTLKDMARKLTGIDSPEAAAIRRAERMFAQAIAETNDSKAVSAPDRAADRFSLPSTQIDSEGETLSRDQQDFFKDSKVRDEDGNLRVVYHGTDADFTVFDRTKSRANMDIQGNFFSPWEIDAGGYGENVKAYYLNITNPAPESVAYRALRRFQGQNEAGVKAREFLESLGYDGVNNGDEEYIAFYPEQIKEVSNQKPTSNPDVRFSLKDFGKPTYEQLITKPDIQVVDLRGSSFEWDDNLSAKNNYERNGLFSAPIINDDTKEGLFITPNTLTHAISDKGASITGVIRNLPDIIKNAVLVSAETDKNVNAQTDGAYVFFGAGENEHGVIPVELVVKEYETSRIMPNKYQKDYVEKHSPNTIANIHDAKGLFIQKIDLGDSFNSGRYTSLEAALPTSPKSTISVEELLGLVKGDARKHIPSETVDARLSIGDNWENAKIPERRLDSIANGLKRQFNTKMDINDLKQTIGELYDMYDMDLTEDERREVFRTMAREMESQIPESKRRDAESQGVLEKLKERPISLTESQRSEIVHTFGSMNDFRKEIAPLKLRSDGIDLESAWKDWSDSASTLGMIDSEVNPLDMPAALVDLVERLKGSRELIDHDDRVDQIVDYLENAYQESVFEEPDIDLYEAANGGWNTKWEQRDPTDSAEYKELMGDDNDGDIPLTDIRSAGFAQQIQGNKGMSGFDTLKRTLDKAAGGNQQIREWFQKVIERPLYDAKAAYTRNRITAYNNLDKVVNEYGIKAGTKESAAVQWYGEGYRVNDDGTRQAYTLNDLKQEFPDTWQNIQKMEQWCRNQYNEYVDKINGALESIYPDVEEKALAKLASLQDSRDGLVNQARSIEEHIRRGETSAAYSGDTLAYVQRQISDLNTQIDEMERSIRDGSYLRNKRLIPRTDYFHHFNEVSNKGIGGLKNLLRGQMTLIDTELVGKSDTTKPKSKWMSFLQSRGNGEFTADAVGGMARYMPGAEFVIAMDPAIAHMRAVIKELATSTKKTRNANGLISYLTNYTNDIAGKTAGIDRSIMNLFGEVDGRAKLDAIRRLNSRFKANAVGGNIRSALAQFSNIPTALGVVKSESAWIKGLRDYLDLKVKRSSDLLDSSEFMTERYFDDSIDRFTEDSFGKKIKQFSNAMLEFGDREAAQWIWFSAYEEALEQGVEDPVFYADQATQQSVGGRGVGEVPYNMSTKIVNLLAPFQVEVNNTWQQMKKMVSEKDAKGLMRFMIGSFVMESMMEQVFGIDVIPDFLGTMIDTIIGAWREKDEEEPDYQGVIGKGIRDAIGEIIGAIPGASLIAPVIFGIDSDTGEALFGEGNPSRYGTGLGGLSRLSSTAAELVKAGVGEQELGDVDLFGPMVETLLPFGGRQLTRTYQTAQDLGLLPAETWGNIPFAGGEYREVPGSYTNSGALRFELPSSPETPEDVMEMARALMLGEYSTQAGREYLETRKPQVSASKMEKINEYAGAGYDPQDFIDFYASVDSNGNGSISQAEAQEYLDSTDLDNDQKLMIWTLIGPNWKKNPYA